MSSCASGDRNTLQLVSLVRRAGSPNHLVNIEFLTLAVIKGVDSFLQPSSKMLSALYAGNKILGDALLCCLGQSRHFVQGFLKHSAWSNSSSVPSAG